MGQKMWGYRCALASAAALAIGLPLRAEEGASRSDAKAHSRVEAERRIEAALDLPLRAPLEFIETPLNQITEVLSEDYDIPILFDTIALDAIACSPEIAVSIQVGNVSLRSALNLMLRNTGEGDLTYIVQDEVLLITSQEEEEKQLDTRVYRIDDLVDMEDPTSIDLPDYDSLIDAIVSTVESESWLENGTGRGDIQPYQGTLVISQTRRIHDRIEQFLDRLRSAMQSIEADASKDHAATSNRPVTRSIVYQDSAIADSDKNRHTIHNVIRQSVDWEPQVEGVEEADVFLHVLPGRILVRHVPAVVRQVQRVAEEVCGARTQGKLMWAPTGSSRGVVGGRKASSDAEAPGQSGVAPSE